MDDEKTLKIKVVYGPDDGKPDDRSPSTPKTAPKEPKTPSAPANPQSSPGSKPTPSTPSAPSSGSSPTPASPASPSSPGQAPAATPKPGNVTSAVAATTTNVASTAASTAGSGAGNVLSTLGSMAIAAGGVIAVFGALVAVTGLVMNQFEKMVDRLAQYDPGIAVAQGMAELQQMQNDMKMARETSKEMQSFIKEKADFETILSRIEIQLMKVFLPIAENILLAIEAILGVVEFIMKMFGELKDAIFNIFESIPVVGRGVAELHRLLKEWLKKQLNLKDDMEIDKLQQDIRDALRPSTNLYKAISKAEEKNTKIPKNVRF